MFYKIFFVSLFFLHFFLPCQARPVSKRTVSEMQLMHNLGQHKQVQERRDWLQSWLRGIHNAEQPQDLNHLTEEEIQHALDFLEKLAKSKQT